MYHPVRAGRFPAYGPSQEALAAGDRQAGIPVGTTTFLEALARQTFILLPGILLV